MLVGIVLIVGLAGCAPCTNTSDCGDGSYCGAEGFCRSDCLLQSDCPSPDQNCTAQGECLYSLAPKVEWIAPAPGTAVDGPFTVEASVRFVGAEAWVRLERDVFEPGEACAGFTPQQQLLLGDTTRETVATLRFEDVVPAGDGRFGLKVVASTDPLNERAAVAILDGVLPEGTLLGAEVEAPAEGLILLEPAISVPVRVRLPEVADRVWAFIDPASAPATPRRTVALSTIELDGPRVPVVRGPQLLKLEIERGARVQTCAIGLDTPPADFNRLEVALFFDGPAPGDLDLWIYAVPDEDDDAECTAGQPGRYCKNTYATLGVREWGEEAIQLDVVDGTYGVAVAPGAVSPALTATVRISRADTHLGFLGPRTVFTELGEVWLAGRIEIRGGVVSVVPISAVSTGLPSAPPGDW